MKKVLIHLLVRSFLFMMVCVVVALLFNRISPHGLSLLTRYRTVVVKGEDVKIPLLAEAAASGRDASAVEAPESHPIAEISLQDAIKLFQAGGAIFIDTRSAEKYREGHISGALSFSIEEQELDEFAVLNLDYTQKIVTYCDGEVCSQSIDLALFLEEIGYYDVYYFLGGWQEWEAANYPIIRGNRP